MKTPRFLTARSSSREARWWCILTTWWSPLMAVATVPSPGPLRAQANLKTILAAINRLLEGREATPTVSDRSIRMLEATGRVKIEKEDGRATCRKAVYYEAEKKIVLIGDPVAWQKGTRVSGKRIIMFLDEDRSVVEGDSQVIIEGESGGKR